MDKPDVAVEYCGITGCGWVAADAHSLCYYHWHLLPVEIQTHIWKANQMRGIEGFDYSATIAVAIDRANAFIKERKPVRYTERR